MPARLTPNQKDRLIDLARRSRRSTSGFYGAFATGTAEGAWIDFRTIGGRATLNTLVSKGYVESREEIGPRGGRILFYRPTMQGWASLARQEKPRDPSPAALVAPDPLCRHCKAPDSWHSEDDGQCPDDDGPHYDSVAAYEWRETLDAWDKVGTPALQFAPDSDKTCDGYMKGRAFQCRQCEEYFKLPALYSDAWPISYAVVMAPREERNANERSGENVRMALGVVRDATREIFRNAR